MMHHEGDSSITVIVKFENHVAIYLSVDGNVGQTSLEYDKILYIIYTRSWLKQYILDAKSNNDLG